MERRKLLLHINPEEEDGSLKGSSTSRLFIECPRIVYTAFCFALFISTCLFLLILFIMLLLLHDVNKNKEIHTDSGDNYRAATTEIITSTTTMYRDKQSMFEYLRGLNKNKLTQIKVKNLTQTCLNLIRADDEYGFNNWTKNNIYFVKAAGEVIDEKFACTVESCLMLNPYKRVYILNMESGNVWKIEDNLRPVKETAPTSTQSHFNYLKSFYKNLKSKDIREESFFKGSPFEAVNFRRDTALTKTMIELVTLWKYSGLVSSKQNLLLSRSFYNQSTILLEKSVYYSSYGQICSPVLEKLLLAFSTVCTQFRNSGETFDSVDTVDDMINCAIDNVTNECGDCDVQKLGLFHVCTVLKPSCYFVNIDAVWNLNKINLMTYCPKMIELISSNETEASKIEKNPPIFVTAKT